MKSRNVTGSVVRGSQAARGRTLLTACSILGLAFGATRLGAQPVASGNLQKNPTGEMRGVYLEWTEADAEKGTLGTKLDAIKSAGFNTVLVPFQYIGYVAYPGSAYLPQNPRHAKHSDIIRWYVDEIHRRGMRVDLLAEYGFTAHRGSSNSSNLGTILEKQPELSQLDTSGTKFTYSSKTGYRYYHMCPSNPKSAEVLGSVCAEAAGKYPADGFVLGWFNYQNENTCYCNYCKEHFRKDTGRELVPFARGSEGAAAFAKWKQERLGEALATVTGKIRQVRPDMPILHDVGSLSSLPARGLSPDAYLRQGLVDVAVVRGDKDVGKTVTSAVRLADGKATRTAIMLSFLQTSQTLASQIGAVRRGKTTGYVVMNSKAMTADHRKALSSGPQSKPAESPFGSPAPPPAETPTPVPTQTPRPTPTPVRPPLEKSFLSLDTAMGQARTSGKRVLIFCHTRENALSKKLWAQMVASTAFYEAASRYVLTAIDTSKPGHVATSKYGVYKIPAFVILSPDGSVERQLLSPESVEELVRFMGDQD